MIYRIMRRTGNKIFEREAPIRSHNFQFWRFKSLVFLGKITFSKVADMQHDFFAEHVLGNFPDFQE